MKLLVIADVVSPIIYSENFPKNLAPFDLVLSAGDMPAYLLEFLATKLPTPPVYVLGNHFGYLRDSDRAGVYDGAEANRLPGGCINAHGRVVEVNGVLIAGLEGSARYRPGPHQYSERQMAWMAEKLTPRLLWNRHKYTRAVDILLTHAPPKGPHEGDDYPHRGIPAFNRFHQRWRPKLHIHGHVHLSGANSPREYLTESGVRVINAYNFALIELER